MAQRTSRPKPVIRRWIAEIEAPLRTGRSELGLASTTAALIKGGGVRVSDEVIKIPSTVIRVGQEISAPEAKDVRKLESADAPKSIRPADDLPFEILYEDDDLFCYMKPAGWVAASPNPRSTRVSPGSRNSSSHGMRNKATSSAPSTSSTCSTRTAVESPWW